jgi:branched-chain amino acid transport system permease protein
METIVQGVTMAAIYTIVAVSFNVIYRPTNIFNFAQGDLLVIGALLAATLVRSLSVPWYAAATIAIAFVMTVSVAIYALAVAPVIAKSPHSGGWIITTLAASIILHEITEKLAGSDPRVLPAPPPLNVRIIDFGAFSASTYQFALVAFACLLVLAAELMDRTRGGRAIRAIAEDREASLLRGIDPRRMTRLSFAIGGAVAAISGILAAPLLFASTALGWTLLIKGFLVVAIGGIGSNRGAIAAAVIIAMIETGAARVLTPALQDAVVFAAALGILLVRPEGIAGADTGRRMV